MAQLNEFHRKAVAEIKGDFNIAEPDWYFHRIRGTAVLWAEWKSNGRKRVARWVINFAGNYRRTH